MAPFLVVEHLDVVEHITPGIFPSQVDFSLDSFSLEQLKKAFSDGIVVAVSSPAHAADDAVRLEECLPVVAGELAALVQHGWPQGKVSFGEAIDWLELQAMRNGTAARREDRIDAQLARARERAASAPSPLERWRALDQLARDFEGLREVDNERAQAAALAASKEVRAALASEQRLLAEEARFARALDAWATRLGGGASESGRLPPPDTARTLSSLRIRSLQQRGRDPDPLVADSATRRLELAFAAGAHYLADEQQHRGNEAGARAALQFAAAVYPERPYPACRLEGLAQHKPLPEGLAACRSSEVHNAR